MTDLLDEGSAVDLVLRGFTREQIRDLIGEDVGYNALSVIRPYKHIDRIEYRAAHVRGRVGLEAVSVVLDQLARGEIDETHLAAALGLGAGEGSARLRKTMAALGLASEFAAARKAARAPKPAPAPEWMGVQLDSDGLYPEDSVLDLAMRGLDRDEIIDRTGVDPGYHNSALRGPLAGQDRRAYRSSHVAVRVGQRRCRELLADYGRGELFRDDLLGALGLGTSTEIALAGLYGDIGLADEFAETESGRRRASMAAGMVRAHGVDNPFKLEEFQEQAAQTRAGRYGARYTLSEGSELAQGARESLAATLAERESEIVSARAATMMREYGVPFAAQSPQVQKRLREKWLAEYGVEHPAQRPEAREAMAAWMRENSDRVIELARGRMLREHGVVNHAQLPERRAAQSARMRDPEHQARITAARKRNGTMKTSAPEVALGAMLREVFGADDVVAQHGDERYRFACDYYVRSRDLFIELAGTWTHGGHWFDETSPEDLARAVDWTERESAYYDNAVVTWTQRDVAKRAAAAEHGLNYVVLWDGSEKMLDAKLWIAMGCPDGRDWEREYSWLPQREFELGGDWPELGAGPRKATAVARRANWRQFYARELELWQANPTDRRKWGNAQARLYANRLEHMGSERGAGKLPDELTDLEILRGLRISGAVRGYTVFDNTAMRAVLDEYAPAAVYDPCAGWGERMVTCAALGIDYLGVDVNPAVVAGHAQIAQQYDLAGQRTVVGDAAEFGARGLEHEMVFTCPPYGDIEIYTAAGAENLDEAGFLAWWSRVVEMAAGPRTSVFAYQVNQRWRERMNAELTGRGWVLVGEVAAGTRSSHFTRGPGGVDRKSESESVQVFEREGCTA